MSEEGHSWNKSLELQFYTDNVKAHGVVVARELSRANARSFRNEKAGIETHWSLHVVDGDMELDDGSSLLQTVDAPFTSSRASLVDDTVRETAKLEKPTIKKAIELANLGEKLIIFPEQHITDDGVMTRYLTVWQQDEKDTKLYHGKRIDLGNNEPVQRAQERIKEYLVEPEKYVFHNDGEDKNIFVVSTSKVSDEYILPVRNQIQAIVDEGVTVGYHVLRDAHETLMYAGDYLVRRFGDYIHENLYKEEEDETRQDLLNLLVNTDFENALLELTIIPKELEGTDVPDFERTEVWKKTAQNELHITEKQSEKLLIEIQESWGVMKEGEDIISFVNETGVGIAAGMYALDILTLQNNPQEEMSIIPELVRNSESHTETGSLEFVVQLPQETKDTLFSFFEATNEQSDVREMKKILPPEIDIDVFIQTINFIRQIDVLPRDKRESAVIREKEKTLIQIIGLYELFVELQNQKRDVIDVYSPREHMVPSTNEHVENFSSVLLMWMLIKMTGYYANLEFVHRVVAKKDTHSLLESIQKKQPEELIQKEPAPWLMFAIIWYLAMIREQGMVQTTANPPVQVGKTQTSGNTKQSVSIIDPATAYQFPQPTVIYAYGS